MDVILVSPDFYRISSLIHPVNAADQFERLKAANQFERLKTRLMEAADVHVIDAKIADPSGTYPNMVFVSNAALLLPGKVAILSRFAFPERRGEEQRLGAYLKHILGYKVISLPEREGLHFEGLRDARWSNGMSHLWLSYGGRTTKAGIEAVREVILRETPEIRIHVLQMVEPRTCYLDLCFLPLPNGRVIFHGGSFSPGSKQEIIRHFGKDMVMSLPLINYMFACNSLVLTSKTLLCPKLGYRQILRDASKMQIIEVNLDQFHLAGGSVSSMVLSYRNI